MEKDGRADGNIPECGQWFRHWGNVIKQWYALFPAMDEKDKHNGVIFWAFIERKTVVL